MLKNKLYVYGPRCLEVPVDLNFGQDKLRKIWSYGDAIALINADTGATLTYRAFAQQVVDVALSLARMGVGRGDVVSICSEKRLEFLPTLLGIICSGATFAAADITCGRATMLHRVNLVKPSIMFCSPDGWKKQKETLQSIDSLHTFIVFGDQSEAEGAMTFKNFLTETGNVEDFLAAPVDGWKDLAIILYSSGTTGMPKAIPLTHLNFLGFIHTYTAYDKVYCGLSFLSTREWYYSYGMGNSLYVLCAGVKLVYSPRNQCEDLLKAIEKYKVQVIQLAPATIVELVKSSALPKYDVSSLERMVSASTSGDAELVKSAKSKFPNLREVYQCYGMTEIGCSNIEEWSTKGSRPGSVGQPSPGYIMKVVDHNTRQPLPPNQRGEICIKPPTVTPGHLDAEGFLLSGDIGYYDEDGYFYIVSRIKELIKFNSFQVAPAELESVLEQHPSVREAGVVGAPHEQYGEAPLAFVALQPGARVSEDELVAYVDTQVSPRMRLEGGVRFVDALPRGAGDKLDRKALELMI